MSETISSRNPKYVRTLERMKKGLPIGEKHGDTYSKKTMKRRARMDKKLVKPKSAWKGTCKSCEGDNETECLVAPYKDQKKKCNGQIHHIIHDSVYRLDKRGSTDRIPGAPSEADGMCICLHDDTHSKLHTDYNPELRELVPGKKKNGKPAPAGTAPMSDIFNLMKDSIDNIEDVPPDEDCRDKAVKAAKQQMKESGMDKHHGRTSKDPIPPPDPAYSFLKSKGY